LKLKRFKQVDLSNESVLKEYKAQKLTERGFRFLKDPLFFTSSVFVKNPQRVEAIAMIMGLCLLVYTLAQRKLRQELESSGILVKNQVKKLTNKPTIRWIFQVFHAVYLIWVNRHKDRKLNNLNTSYSPLSCKLPEQRRQSLWLCITRQSLVTSNRLSY
jgi:transposase